MITDQTMASSSALGPTVAPESSGWGAWLDQLNSDPNMKQALLQFAASNLRTRQPGESSLSVFGDALGRSIGHYNGLKGNDAQNARENAKLELDKQKTGAGVDATNESTKSNRSARNRAEDLHGGTKTLQGEQIKNQQQGRILGNEQNTRDAEAAPLKNDLMRAQAENLRAQTDAAKTGGQMPAAQVQELQIRAQNLMELSAEKGADLSSAQALNQAFQELSVKNPELWNEDVYLRAFNLKRGESGAMFGEGTQLQKQIIETGDKVTAQSFASQNQAQPMPTIMDPSGQPRVNRQMIDPTKTYKTGQGVLTGAQILEQLLASDQQQQAAPLPTN